MVIDRRKFLLKSGVLAAGLSIAGPISAMLKDRTKPIGIGIIGTGDRGRGLASLISVLEGIEVVALCDVLPFRLAKAHNKNAPQAKTYSDYRHLLENKSVDAVVIATPFSMHADMALAALDADKHVYCEKTMVYGADATRKVLERARRSNAIFQTGHQFRSSPVYRHIVSMVREGQLGEISHIENQWNRNGDWRRPVPDPKWERQINWRMYREYSGGLTAELCSHHIDFAHWLIGEKPARVSGFGGIDYWKDGRETYDNVHILAKYPSGVSASFNCLTTNSKDDEQIKILGTKGTIVVSKGSAWLYSEDKGEREYGVVDGVSGATMQAWKSNQGVQIAPRDDSPSTHAMTDFRNAILSGKQPLSDVETGAEVSMVVQMALKAMDNNRVEQWEKSYEL